MKKLKPIYLGSVAAIVLASCSASKNTSFANLALIQAINLEKKTPLKEAELNRWSHLDIQKDTIPGMSVDKAYAELLKGKKGVKVIVGIVDSGVDIEHEDLKSVLWTNPKEIANNNIDDDKNGYVDDIHGWNFLGNIVKEQMEYERIIANKNLVSESTYAEAKAINDKKVAKSLTNKSRFEKMLADATNADEAMAKHFGKPNYAIDALKALQTTDETLARSQNILLQVNAYELTVSEFKAEIQKEIDTETKLLEGSNLNVDYRTVLGDKPFDISDTKYGDNKVIGPQPLKEHLLHGTHVAGIVSQTRNNEKGGDGIADNVEILVVRAVPDGDEYDKDIALGIRYAVDNGAKVINGSFGKSFSPQKNWVDDAIKYAESKDVLIVHSAGNDNKDIDISDTFPNDSNDKKTEFANNMITVGALNFENNANIVADFSNFGKFNVDVFAPGVKIYATAPNNSYRLLQGTSMAAPNVAGVAALIRSYFPKLKANQVKQILMDSGIAITKDVIVAGNPKDVRPFANLSKSGKVVNAYNALIMAAKMSK